MNLVWIRGSAAVLRGLESVPGLQIEPESTRPDGENWRVSAHASDEAITELRARGCEVAVIMDSQRLEDQIQGALSRVDRGGGSGDS